MERRWKPFNGLVELTDGDATVDDGNLSMVLSGKKRTLVVSVERNNA
jgi:hypothetical protein